MANGAPDIAKKKKKKSIFASKSAFHFLSGFMSGSMSAFLLQPAELLKTRVQQSAKTTKNPVLTTLRDIASSDHPIKQLWRGTLPSVIRTGGGSALYFGGLNILRTSIATAGWGTIPKASNSSSALPQLSNIANSLAGAFARASVGFAMMPITVIKVRFESSMYAYKSIYGAGKDIVRTGGYKGLFAGVGATAIRDGPYAGLYVLFYEQSKRRLAALRPRSSGPMSSWTSRGINSASAALAAGTATAITNPFDVIKTRLQVMPKKYGNMWKVGRKMIKDEGARCLFDGVGLRMARKAMQSALAWAVYEDLIRSAEIRWVVDEG